MISSQFVQLSVTGGLLLGGTHSENLKNTVHGLMVVFAHCEQ